jgi:hypothetical protein
MSIYKRKTKDEFQLWIKYEFGWEEVMALDVRKEVIIDLRAYKENDVYIMGWKIKKVRVKI